jgi:hypothetical protein
MEPKKLEEEVIDNEIKEAKEVINSLINPEKNKESTVSKKDLSETLNVKEIGFDPKDFLVDFNDKIKKVIVPLLKDRTSEFTKPPEGTLAGEEKYFLDSVEPELGQILGNVRSI